MDLSGAEDEDLLPGGVEQGPRAESETAVLNLDKIHPNPFIKNRDRLCDAIINSLKATLPRGAGRVNRHSIRETDKDLGQNDSANTWVGKGIFISAEEKKELLRPERRNQYNPKRPDEFFRMHPTLWLDTLERVPVRKENHLGEEFSLAFHSDPVYDLLDSHSEGESESIRLACVARPARFGTRR
ncbi:unnamed protein product [Amoebophrya sp. A120]|nr:unnamed protein product [Amoebophrya sp. A120]|eukprot:GSA120T00022564001.1